MNKKVTTYASFTLPNTTAVLRFPFYYKDGSNLIQATGVYYDGAAFQAINLSLTSTNIPSITVQELSPGL